MIFSQYLPPQLLECLEYENIKSVGCPIQVNAKNVFFSEFCEISVAKTSILHIFFKEEKGCIVWTPL